MINLQRITVKSVTTVKSNVMIFWLNWLPASFRIDFYFIAL